MLVNEPGSGLSKAYWVFVLVWLALSGCAPTYKAPELSTSQVATVMTESEELAVVAVDDVRISIWPKGGSRQVAIAPGEHTITVRHTRNGFVSEGPLTVDFESGARYMIRSASQGYSTMFWAEKEPVKAGSII